MNTENSFEEHKDKALSQIAVSGSAVNLEEYLKENGFELNTYYQTNKLYRKEITDCQILYVRIYSDVNTIQEVEYEHKAIHKFDREGRISFETIDTFSKLKSLLEALS
jgi:hypothetical protein